MRRYADSRHSTARLLRCVSTRRGGLMALIAPMMVMILAFTAFTVDVGFILVTKAQLQNASDAASLAASQDLLNALGVNAPLSMTEAQQAARQSAFDIAARHRTGDRGQVHVDSARDVRFGQVVWNSSTGTWQKNWGVAPYNLAEVTVHRDTSGAIGAPDGPLNLFFAPVIGHTTASLMVRSTAAVPVGVGVRGTGSASASSGSSSATSGMNAAWRIDVLPIAVDEESWQALLDGTGSDNWSHSPANRTVTNGSDGVCELNIYPTGSSRFPPGNRGTVDIGSPNNSTSDLKRQIVDGLSEEDLSYFPNGELRFDNGPLSLNGDTGLSAGIESSLQSIIGQPRLIPIFRSVTGNGNNAQYEIVKFVGVTLLSVKLTGSPSQKRVIAQPCTFSSSAVIRGFGTPSVDSFYASPVLLPSE